LDADPDSTASLLEIWTSGPHGLGSSVEKFIDFLLDGSILTICIFAVTDYAELELCKVQYDVYMVIKDLYIYAVFNPNILIQISYRYRARVAMIFEIN